MWRFYPWIVAGAMAIVIAVNGGMVYAALHTYPGSAGDDGFDLSNHYDTLLDRRDRQAALGWTATAEIDASGHPVLAIRDRNGAAIAGAAVQGHAERPVGDKHETPAAFRETAPGAYRSDAVLTLKGQWDLMLSVTVPGHDLVMTRRVIAR